VSDDLRKFLANARGSAASARVLRLDDLVRLGQSGPEVDADASPWGLAAMRGRLVELSARGATATLTTAAELVLEAQRAAEPVAWVVPWSLDCRLVASASTFYPPDVAETGIDLAALVVVRAPSTIAAARAAERLLRSGAFGLVVLDFASVDLEANRAQRLPDQVLGRLVSLAQSHDAAVICLTEKTSEAGSLGSLVSMRVEAMRLRQPGSSSETGFEVTIRALKDKRRGPGWSKRLKARGPAGMG
jgi:recombination protein RecA